MTCGDWMSHTRDMAAYLLCHRHTASECAVSFAAWKGFSSPLRRQTVMSSCTTGGHQIWWSVEAPDAATALAFLPGYVAARTEAVEVEGILVP